MAIWGIHKGCLTKDDYYAGFAQRGLDVARQVPMTERGSIDCRNEAFRRFFVESEVGDILILHVFPFGMWPEAANIESNLTQFNFYRAYGMPSEMGMYDNTIVDVNFSNFPIEFADGITNHHIVLPYDTDGAEGTIDAYHPYVAFGVVNTGIPTEFGNCCSTDSPYIKWNFSLAGAVQEHCCSLDSCCGDQTCGSTCLGLCDGRSPRSFC